MSNFDVAWCRAQFPALQRQVNGSTLVHFDGPAGSQIPKSVAEAVSDYLLYQNANHGGYFATGRESDAMLHAAHEDAGELLNCAPDLVAFGANMTTLAFHLAHTLSQEWNAGDEIIVTHLDHDANIAPWVRNAERVGAVVKHIDIHEHDCTLNLETLDAALSARTRLVAVGAASNCVGTVNPIRTIAERVHRVGAELFVDAVHFAPHRAIDVEAMDCDWLACSAYKFFGPHIGLLYGKRPRFEEAKVFKVRPASNMVPDRWMTGTQNHEGIAGFRAAIAYLREISAHHGGPNTGRASLVRAFELIQAHEAKLTVQLLEGLAAIPSVNVLGITNPTQLSHRVATVSFTHQTLSSQSIARTLAEHGICVWDGHHYALAASERLGLEPEGMLRVGLLHYNTAEELKRLFSALQTIV